MCQAASLLARPEKGQFDPPGHRGLGGCVKGRERERKDLRRKKEESAHGSFLIPNVKLREKQLLVRREFADHAIRQREGMASRDRAQTLRAASHYRDERGGGQSRGAQTGLDGVSYITPIAAMINNVDYWVTPRPQAIYGFCLKKKKKPQRIEHTAKQPSTRSLKVRGWSRGSWRVRGWGVRRDISTRYLQNSSRDRFRSRDIYNLYKVPREQGHLSPPLPQAKTWSSQSLMIWE